MRMAINLVSAVSKIPKTNPRHCYVSIRTTYDLMPKGQRRSHLQLGKCCKDVTPSVTQIRRIRVTDPKRGLHPILLLLLRPISKAITIITGRLIRLWWKRKSPEEKQIILDKIRGQKTLMKGLGSLGVILFVFYYYAHLEETPLTKRKRFIMMNDEVMAKLSQYASQTLIHEHKRDLVPVSHPFFQRTGRVTNAIVSANSNIPEMRKYKWSLFVIDRPDIVNACCLANGNIFVFTGILNLCSNDDQLAIVLSHEISHTILGHPSENLSKVYLLEAFLLIPSFICWIIFTDMWAIISEGVIKVLADIFIRFPFSRALEREADVVGLMLAARACVDVREATDFWAKMSEVEASVARPQWLSTHPASEERKKDISKILPVALELRTSSNCAVLKPYKVRFFFG